MNAHHKKSTYKPPAPVQRARYTAGTAQLSGTNADEACTQLARLSRAVERLPFGWQLDAIIPSVGSSGSAVLADELKKAVSEACPFYLCEGVNLADLLEPEFLNSFIRTGSLVALSLDDSEGADVVAIDGRGRLVLSVSKDTYELLGFPGRASAYGTLRQRFIIELPLTEPYFRAGKPGFERTKRALRNWPRRIDLLDELSGHGAPSGEGKTFDLVMAFTDDEGVPQPLSLPAPLRAQPLPPTLHSATHRSLLIPSSSSLPPPPSAAFTKKQRTSSGAFRRTPLEADAPELFWESYREWTGLVRLGAGAMEKLRPEEADEDDAWGVERARCEEGEAQTLCWEGLLHPKALARALRTVLASSSLASHPFLSLSLTPFAHAPISHLSAASPPVVGTSQRPNGKKRKRGRGRGEEEEADRARVEDEGGWECVVRPVPGERSVEWHLWEGQ
ncbi:hypothetical protein JCM10450v2_003738 [Rhodotorula kratochvilovae]